MKALNVDGTENKRGTIKQYVDLTFTINGRPQTQRLYLTGLGKQRIILGFPWLQKQNPIGNHQLENRRILLADTHSRHKEDPSFIGTTMEKRK